VFHFNLNLRLEMFMRFYFQALSSLIFLSPVVWGGVSDDLILKAKQSAIGEKQLLIFALRNVTPVEFCEALDLRGYGFGVEAYSKLTSIAPDYFSRYGLSSNACHNERSRLSSAKLENSVVSEDVEFNSSTLRLATTTWESETYNIDLLKIDVFTDSSGLEIECSSGARTVFVLTGQIGPDSTFAMTELFNRNQPCADDTGSVLEPTVVSLQSGGGFLEHGYNLGYLLQERKAHAVVASDKACASSCAVAFLGGKNRVVEDGGRIMFHAPYFSGKNMFGERDINCDVGEESLNKLKDYYISMTDKETGERLFERTMWYCSADDGWVVTGGAAAELYGIATER
jgi:ATP-dependent protease ClpP protease subunit